MIKRVIGALLSLVLFVLPATAGPVGQNLTPVPSHVHLAAGACMLCKSKCQKCVRPPYAGRFKSVAQCQADCDAHGGNPSVKADCNVYGRC
jgi:hypothetical protein